MDHHATTRATPVCMWYQMALAVAVAVAPELWWTCVWASARLPVHVGSQLMFCIMLCWYALYASPCVLFSVLCLLTRASQRKYAPLVFTTMESQNMLYPMHVHFLSMIMYRQTKWLAEMKISRQLDNFIRDKEGIVLVTTKRQKCQQK